MKASKMDSKKEKINITKKNIKTLNNFLEETLKDKLTNQPLPPLDEIKLSDRLETFTQNPIEKLAVSVDNAEQANKTSTWLFGYNFWLIVLVVCLISSSILFNSFFSKSVDPFLFKLVALSSSAIKENEVNKLVNDLITTPYVVTIGEFGNYAIAKDEAIKLLPQLKQIDIKELESGVLTFEIERLGSKTDAYSLANDLTQRGFEAVHVRYLPSK